MLKAIWTWLDESERRVRRSFGKDISTPWGRFLGHVHYHVFDHAFLRIFWTNFEEIAPGVYRSNHPTHRRLKAYRDMGIVSVLSLRGEEKFAHWLFEKESCEELGLKLHTAKLWARHAAKRDKVVAVLDELRRVEKPFVFHCKSGADRAGFVAAMYLMVFEGQSVQEARRMLSFKYLHLKSTKTGVQDYILDVFEARQAQEQIDFETWLRTEYRGARITDAWEARATADETATMLRSRAATDAGEL